jgi:4-amino-4-deoxy-L-arabinose transferase-like glycosyltransferase
MSLRKAAWLALAFTALRFFYAPQIQLAPDEAYYWEWSRSPALSYYDQGPGLSLAIRLGTALAGQNELGVRLASLLAGLGTSLLAAWFCVAALGSGALALWVVLAFNVMLLFSVGGVLMMHDSLLGFFWMAALAALAKFRLSKNGAYALLAGLFTALGFLSKYTGAMLGASVFLLVILERRWRSPWLWAAALLAACGSLPVLIWNAQQGWPSFQHVFSLAGADAARVHWQAFPEFLGSQFGLVTPLLFWAVLMAWLEAWKRWRAGRGSEAESLLLFASLPVFLFFTLMSLRSRVEGNWPAPAYLGGLMLAGLRLSRHQALGGRFSRWALGTALAFSLFAFIQAAWPFLPLTQSLAKLDTASRVDGWRELGARVYAERQKLGPGTFTAARSYQNAAELAFYQPDQQRSLVLQDAVLMHQYRFWNDPQAHAGQDAILVTNQDWELGEMGKYFKKVEALPDEVFLRHGLEVRRSHLFRAYGFNPAGQAS